MPRSALAAQTPLTAA